MAIELTSTFGKNLLGRTANTKPVEEREAAKIWLNVGFQTEVEIDGETQTKFVSLQQGIPLSTLKTLPTNSRTEWFAQLNAARNDLRDQLMEFAKDMKPGDEHIIGDAGGLQIQIRHIQEEREPVKADSNPFVRRLDLVDA